MFSFGDIEIAWYGQDGFKLRGGGKVIWIDPFKIPDGVEKADILLISHDHFDHYNPEDLAKVVQDSTITLSPFDAEVPKGEVKKLPVGKKETIDGIAIEAVSAYNTTKTNEQGEPPHPKSDERCGFLITIGDTTVYHAGDTDHIPEMADIRADVFLVPVSGTYVMTAEEAVGAVNEIKPKVAIPMHYGGIVGSEDDAKHLKEHTEIAVEVLQPEKQ